MPVGFVEVSRKVRGSSIVSVKLICLFFLMAYFSMLLVFLGYIKHLQRIDGFHFRFLRRIIGIKASYCSRISNSTVYHNAGKPKLPSESIVQLQHKMLSEVFLADMQEPIHNVVFCSGYLRACAAAADPGMRGRKNLFEFWSGYTP